jgi:stalled ribosome rescue protein Dom34
VNQAKKFLRENPTESQVVAAKIFNVNRKSLNAFIKRGSGEKHEGHNKVLQDHEINALDDFIRSLLKHEILPTSEIVFSAIVGLKRAHRRLFISVELLQLIHDPETE